MVAEEKTQGALRSGFLAPAGQPSQYAHSKSMGWQGGGYQAADLIWIMKKIRVSRSATGRLKWKKRRAGVIAPNLPFARRQ